MVDRFNQTMVRRGRRGWVFTRLLSEGRNGGEGGGGEAEAAGAVRGAQWGGGDGEVGYSPGSCQRGAMGGRGEGGRRRRQVLSGGSNGACPPSPLPTCPSPLSSAYQSHAFVLPLSPPSPPLQDPSFILLLSSKAGGTGLNIIGANRLVLLDPGDIQ